MLAYALLLLVQTAPAAPAMDHSQHAAPATAPAATSRLNLDTPLETIVADPAGKAVIDAQMPGVTTHPSYEMFKQMSLNQLVPYSQGKMTPESLAATGKALAAIK